MNRRYTRLFSLVCMLMLCFMMTNSAMAQSPLSDDIPVDDMQQSSSRVAPNSLYTTATVNVTALNIRSGPGVEYDIIGVLGKSQPILVLARSEDWYVIYDYDSGRIGCVNGYYITIVSDDSKDDPKLPGDDAPSTGDGENGANGENSGTNGGSNTQNVEMSDDATRLMSLVNDMRTRHGLSSVQYSATLSKVAQDKAEDMVTNTYFSHQSEIYGTPFEMMRAYGVYFTAAAENIAGNQTIDGAFYAWMNSDSHKANIMSSSYTQMGVGVCVSPIYGKIIVQMFIG